jgi:hypothetical protein
VRFGDVKGICCRLVKCGSAGVEVRSSYVDGNGLRALGGTRSSACLLLPLIYEAKIHGPGVDHVI